MLRDIRLTEAFRSVENFYNALLLPGAGHVFSASEVAIDHRGGRLYLAGVGFSGTLEDGPSTQIYRLESGRLTPVSRGPAKLPRSSPRDGRLAFVAPQDGGDLLFLEKPDGTIAPCATFEGHVEELSWSPDGTRLLLTVAGLGADLSGHEGGFATARTSDGPEWLPNLETGTEENLWRRLWIYEIEPARARALSPSGTNVWEASWCGNEAAIVVCSSDHGEGSWYKSSLALIDLDRTQRTIYAPNDQIGLPAGSPDGTKIAFVEAFCSDRGVVCGTLKLLDRMGHVHTLDTDGVEVTSVVWRNDDVIHYAGHRAFETVVGDYAISTGRARELWKTEALTAGEWYPASQPLRDDQCIVVAEAYNSPPHVLHISPKGTETLFSFASTGASDFANRCGTMEPVRWNAPDGLEIHGWFVRPQDAKPPYRLMMDIHGGPVWANRNRWMGRLRATALLAQQGCAVLYPNPRGSSTRGQEFARLVHGDMGGADSDDLLAACDALAARGLIDRKAIALTGTSYGGFMSSWLVTRDPSFAAAMPISPVTDWYSQHRTSQIPFFDEMFLCASASEPDNKFFHRSPVMFANRVKSPTLVMAGARDKNTPPGQAMEFYRSLLEHGVETALAIYPKDGHSLRGYPAYIDTAARILMWLETYVPAAKS